MPHYEVIAIIHPDQHARAGEMAERYKKIVNDGGGIVHRFEDWGLRTLAYPMKKQRRAQYILLNIECEAKTLGELQENFRFSDAVMRSLVVRCEQAVTLPSPMMKKIKEEQLAAQTEAENKAKAASESKTAETPAAAEAAETIGSAAQADVKDQTANGGGEVKDKKPTRKERAKAAAAADEEEGDKSIKAPRKSAARSRRAAAEDDGEDDGE